MENNYFSTDVSMFVTSLKAIRQITTPAEFNTILYAIQEASDWGKLDQVLSQSEYLYNQGVDLATAFHTALQDIVLCQGENF